ncbi:alpha/beta hydrolase [Halobellus salinisoli]|uniref:alpha/beta hydrolase n=1 Tax=Halobellus salinisoli TaxID=3108500 RepID=UPI003009CCCA
MSDPIFLPGGRDARGTLDAVADDDERGPSRGNADSAATANACVVACPPHPQHGGTRRDQRLRAVSDELSERKIDCLRFDYGPWDGGRGERTDVCNAVAWARERYDRVALFGFSFGGALALSAANNGAAVDAVAALAPPARLGTERSDPDAPDNPDVGGVDAVADLDEMSADLPVQILYGTRDDVADVGPVVAAARKRGFAVVEFAADHFFVGQEAKVADAVVDFLEPPLQAEDSR